MRSADVGTDRPARRVKVFAHKTRTGCITCRVRRVKCDERKPVCQRCETTERICDGYGPIPPRKPTARKSVLPKPFSSQSEAIFENAVSSTTSQSVPCQISNSCKVSMNWKEMRSLEYFRERTIPQLSGFFESQFWDCHILRATNTEPAIRHAILALGSLHERFEAGDPSVSRSNLDKFHGGFALEQYTMAIGCLIDPVSIRHRQSLDIVLTACVLFTCFETLRGHHTSALSQVKNGIKILRELRTHSGSKLESTTALTIPNIPMVPYDVLQVMFARFDCQSIRLGADNGPIDYATSSTEESCFSNKIPWKFNNVKEARNSMEYHELKCNYFLRNIESYDTNDLESESQRRRLLDDLTSWHGVFKQFLQDKATQLSAINIQATRLLQTRYLVLSDMLSVADLANEMTWDEHIPLYGRITELVAQIVGDATYNNKLNDKTVPVFSMDNGVAGPLFHVIRRCRDPRIRRKAILLWRATPRQEGIWDGFLARKVAERMAELEEDGIQGARCCSDIPHHTRIAALGLRFHHQEKRADIYFSKQWSIQENLRQNPGGIIHDVLTW